MVLASGIEMARYTWSDQPQVASIRSQYAQRHVFSGQSKQSKQQNKLTYQNLFTFPEVGMYCAC